MPRVEHMWRSACILVVTGALVGALATPADAAESGVPGSAVLGGFSLGDGLEALVDEHDGALRVDLPVAGVGLVWDSRRVGHDRSGLGVGWGWAVGSIDVQGGVRVFPSSGGVYDADASAPTGLAGYGGGDVRFEQREGMLEARPGVVETRLFSYVLHELGGGSTYFSAAGDPIAQVAATGDRLDWLWANEPAHRLTAVVGAEGVRTELEWTADQETVVVRPAANVPGSAGSEWRIELGTYGPTEVVDAGDHVRSVGYDPQGNLVAVTSATGAATEVEWASSQDGVTRVSRVQTVEPDGDELSTREWSVAAGDSPTGWPVRAGGAATDVVTRLSDGASEVVSSYSSAGLLAHRSFQVSEPAGLRAVQEVEFGYASASGGVPASWARPTSTAITALDARGGARETRESSRYDELGRVVEHTSADGSITRTEYDPRVVEPIGGLPVGLPVREVLEAPDGLVRERVNTLNERGTAVIATQITERAAGAEAAVTERVEYDVDDDGFVRTKREYPTGPTVAVPVVTSWNEQVDLAAGTVTTTQTVGDGTAAEATTAQVTSLVHGGVVAEVDALGHRTSADFDELGRLEARHDVEGRVTTYAYESGDGQRTVTETAPDGVARSEVHDALGRVVEIFDNIDHGEPVPGYVRRVESREYSPGMVRVTDAWGAVSSSRHDAFGRTVAAEGPSGAAELTEYDDARGVVRSGRSTTGDLAGASVVRETTLDAAGRAVRVDETRDDGSQMTATSEFDGFGRPTSTESAGLETEVRYDEFGRPSSTTLTSTDVGGGSATPSDPLLTAAADFDSFGRTTGKTLSDRAASYDGYTRTLDELGRMVEEVDPSGASTTYDYTVDGLVETIATSAGQRTEIEYDPTTREKVLERVTSPVGDDVATAFEYDPATGRLSAVADADDPQGTRIDYEYDAFGNPLEVAYSDGAVIAYEYDEHGRRTSVTDPVGARTEYTYTGAGLLASAVQRDETGIVAEAAYTYDALGRVTAVDRGNGVRTAYAFTASDEIASEVTTRDGDPITERTYTYAAGDLVRRVDVRHEPLDGDADGDPARPVTTSTEYEYDALHRLVGSIAREGAAADSPVRTSTRYELTVAGDIAAETVQTRPGRADATITVRRFDYGARGELGSLTTRSAAAVVTVEQQYDPAGNLTRSVDGAVSGYDAANRRVSTTSADGVTTTTGYWPDGSRRSQVTGDVATSFYWDGDTLINERETHGESDAAGTASYLIGASRLARSNSTASSARAAEYYSTDRHGNVTELTDQHAAVVATYDYGDYGVTSSSVRRDEPTAGLARNPYQFAGEYTDRDGTQLLATRVYDSVTARFTSLDKAPLGNRFAFADLNPIMHVDPTGRTSALDVVNWIVAGTALVAGVASAVGTFWAMAVSRTLGAMSIAASVADTVALGFATAGLVDSYAFDFMDRETADLVALGDITLGLGLGLGLGVLDGILSHTDRALRRITTVSTSKRAPIFDDSLDPDSIDIGRPFLTPKASAPGMTFEAATTERLMQWRLLKGQLRELTVLSTQQQRGLVAVIEQDELFLHLSGLIRRDGAPIEPALNGELVDGVTMQELLADTTIRDPGLYKTNRYLVSNGRATVLRLSSRSYVS